MCRTMRMWITLKFNFIYEVYLLELMEQNMISMYIYNNYAIITKRCIILDMCNVFSFGEYFKFSTYVCILFDSWYMQMFCKYVMKCMSRWTMLTIYWGVRVKYNINWSLLINYVSCIYILLIFGLICCVYLSLGSI